MAALFFGVLISTSNERQRRAIKGFRAAMIQLFQRAVSLMSGG